MEINKVPFNEAYPDIISLLESMRDTALCGGAPRDHLVGRDIVDFDFFTVKREKEEFKRVLRKLGVENIEELSEDVDKSKKSLSEGWQGTLEYVLEGKFKGYKVQFIVLNETEFDPDKWITDFKFGPSEVAILKERTYRMTEFFRLFLEKGYVVSTEKPERARPKYLQKMKSYFPTENHLWLYYK